MITIEVIIHSTDKEKTELCLSALGQLNVPDGCAVKVQAVESGLGTGSVYRQLSEEGAADYFVYLSEDTVILDNDILTRFMEAFDNNDDWGALGVCGAKNLLSDCITGKSPSRLGQIYDSRSGKLEKWRAPADPAEECLVVDGGLMVCRGAACWRTDILSEDSLLMAAACLEQRRKGKKIAVIRCGMPAIACGGFSTGVNKENRKAFLAEYEKEIFPLVSVVIPTYNRPRYFREALESVLNQSYKNLDIFITDNSHNTLTAGIMEEYLANDSRIRYEHHPEYDAGGNWRRALDYNNPSAEYVNWLMDDDRWYPEKITRMMDCFLSHDNIGLVTSVRGFIDKDGDPLKVDGSFCRMPVKNTAVVSGDTAGRKILFDRVNFIGEPTTVLVRKKYLIDGYRLGFSGSEGRYFISDYPSWLRVLAQSDMIYITEPLSVMRLHAGQDQRSLGTMIRGTVCWLLAFNYAWERGVFYRSEQEYLASVTAWLNQAENLLSGILRRNLFDGELPGFVEQICKAYHIIEPQGKNCVCCGHHFLYYRTEPVKKGSGGDRAEEGVFSQNSRIHHRKRYTCPVCGASERDRAYALWLNRRVPKNKEIRIADIAYSEPLRDFIKKEFLKADYLTMNDNKAKDKAVDFYLCSADLEIVEDNSCPPVKHDNCLPAMKGKSFKLYQFRCGSLGAEAWQNGLDGEKAVYIAHYR